MEEKKILEQQRYTCGIGALQTVAAIEKAVPVLHSGPGCGTMIAAFFEHFTGYAGGNTSPCTNFSEKEVVFGGVEKLRTLIENSSKVLDADLFVVLTGCAAAVVGDDINSVVDEFSSKGLPIVSAETAGFKYTNYESHSVVVNSIIDQFVDKNHDKTQGKNNNLVNVFATIPFQDQFWKGNLFELKRLLTGIGLEVNILFGPYSGGIEEWKTIPDANFNINVSSWANLNIVEHLEKKYSQPYFDFPYLPIGGNETERFLNEVIEFAIKNGAEIDLQKAREFIEREKHAFYEEIDNLATFVMEFRYGLPNHVNILHDSSYVIGMSKFILNELGIVPTEVFITEIVPEKYRKRINNIVNSISNKRHIELYYEENGSHAQTIIKSKQHEGIGLIIGSGWDKDLAKETGSHFISAALPSPYRLILNSAYIGFHGGLKLTEDIFNTTLISFK